MKILQIGMGNVAGGLEAFVMNYYRVLVRMDVQFDFVCMPDVFRGTCSVQNR